jgi:tetratricopeptide (TPR) repeat protein
MESLDTLGTRLGTDKGAIGQGYLAHYERNFAHFKEKAFTLMEIGVAKGSSLEMWSKYFPKATIVGVDINEECRRFAKGSIHIEIGSQTDEGFLRQVATEYNPSIIIDDGSHLAAHNMITFRTLFPLLRSDGLYVVEDLYLHYTNPVVYQQGAEILPADYFARLAVKLASEDSARPLQASSDAILSKVDRIEFIRRGVVIQAKAETDPAAVLASAWPLVESARSAFLWHTLGTFVLANGLDLKQAETAANKAISIEPKSHGLFVRLADILERQGRIPEALEATRRALLLQPTDEKVRRLVERMSSSPSAAR